MMLTDEMVRAAIVDAGFGPDWPRVADLTAALNARLSVDEVRGLRLPDDLNSMAEGHDWLSYEAGWDTREDAYLRAWNSAIDKVLELLRDTK